MRYGVMKNLKAGVNTYAGHCTYEAVAQAQGISYTSIDALIEVTSATAG